MKITMNDTRITNLNQIKGFLLGSDPLEFKALSAEERYRWIKDILNRFRYRRLGKKERGLVRGYIKKITGYSDSQLTRLIRRYHQGSLRPRSCERYRFSTRYGPEEIALLAKTDNAHSRLSGPATRKILEREYRVFEKKEYEKLRDISVSHLYRLRKKRVYQTYETTFTRTTPSTVNIGERRKPDPQGKPGYIRVDTVHQGDRDQEKGVYHINTVDEVLQWEVVGATEKIGEHHLQPVVEDILDQYPYTIIEFHPDNGSEYINYVVAELLNKLRIELTRSRPRHPNDNALVETKNGAVIRKHMGYFHIPQSSATKIHRFYKERFNPYLNYHRPSGYATEKVDRKGKIKKVYETYEVPYERLKGLPNAQRHLKRGITFDKLDKIAYEHSDTGFAAMMEEAKRKLFKEIGLIF